ncbi:hypothetical protein E1B28_010619 [Marasmius oreades]|uniref:Xylanolytic transcriptional activator regulatory domain-containing protein n=1 Tax=Marasmius oreades TaxID=181124 RepID=A0A9P7RXF7_9AGAR|nr:uncharacterized protein E1B28_010619 [Marasmius oreades]KAG7091599.1 hypothetical protein E1B28_010619 [Marasmius oreades]
MRWRKSLRGKLHNNPLPPKRTHKTCLYVGTNYVENRAMGHGVTVEAVDEVLNRVVALEQSVSRLSKMMANSPSEGSAMNTEFIHHPNGHQKRSLANGNTNGTQGVAGSKPQQPQPPQQLPTEEDAAMILADLAMGNRMNIRRSSMHMEANSNPGRAPRSFPGLANTPMQLPQLPGTSKLFPPNANGISEEHPLSLLVRPTTSVIHQILSHLPAEADARGLVRFYFERIEWYTRIIHYPTFCYETKMLTRQISDTSASSTPGTPSISLPFLSTYFMVLCLSYHFIEPEMCKALDTTFEEAAEMSKKMYNAAQLCLWIGNHLENHSLEFVQTLILMGIYQQNLGDSDSHWALLGSAIKIAQNLGVDRLGHESDKRIYPAPWKSVVRREVGRRVWWNLIHNEWSNAAAHSGAYAIIPSQNYTGLPLNINDIDLDEEEEESGGGSNRLVQPAPHNQYTEMTYSLIRFRFVEIHRQIVDTVEKNPIHPGGAGWRPSFIAETDARVLTMLKELPAAFALQSGERSVIKGLKNIEYTVSLITGEALRMRLHRPFLFRGYTDDRFAASKQQCVASARAILKYLKNDIGQTTVLLRRWSVMFFGFTASIVLLVDYCQQRAIGALQDSRKELQSALNLFKTVQVSSTAAQNIVPLLESMIAAAEHYLVSNKHSHSGSSRPGHDDHDLWSEIAKEAIANAGANGKIRPQHLAPLLPSILVPNVNVNANGQNPTLSPSGFLQSLGLPKVKQQQQQHSGRENARERNVNGNANANGNMNVNGNANANGIGNGNEAHHHGHAHGHTNGRTAGRTAPATHWEVY